MLRGKIFLKEIPEEKNPTLKKISFMAFNVEKKSYTFVCHGKKKFNSIARRLAGKKFLPKPKPPYSPPPPPPSKVKWFVPNNPNETSHIPKQLLH